MDGMSPQPAREAAAPSVPPPGRRPEGREPTTAAAWVLGVLSAVALGFVLLLLRVVVPTYTAPGPGEPGYGSVDPHGYVMILGTVTLVFSALVLTCLVVAFGVLVARIRRSRR